MATYRIEHATEYEHTGRVTTSRHVAYLTPRALPWQSVLWHDVSVEPIPAEQSSRTDYFGNPVEQFTMLTPYKRLSVIGRSAVEVLPRLAAMNIENSPAWEAVRDDVRRADTSGTLDVTEFSYGSPYAAVGQDLAAFARGTFAPGRPMLSAAVALMHRIHEEFQFDPAATTITTPVTRVLTEHRGVCQDFAHLLVGALRSLGLPARYISGYLLTDPPPGQPRLIGADASHAWISVWCPRNGWVDLDPTNGVMPDIRHVTLAWGRDYGDVSPLRGVVLGGGAHVLRVGVSVIPTDAIMTGSGA